MQVFGTRDQLLEWVRKVAFRLGFVVVILRSDKATGAQGRKTYVLLGCERSKKYRKYRTNLEVTITDTRKCDYPFRSCGKPTKGVKVGFSKLYVGCITMSWLIRWLFTLMPVGYDPINTL